MPPASRTVVEAMACLGGRAEVRLMQTVTDAQAGVVDQQLAPALDECVLVVEPGPRDAVRFRHDRTREVILRGLDPQRRRALQLFFFQAEDGIRDLYVTGVQTCALPI